MLAGWEELGDKEKEKKHSQQRVVGQRRVHTSTNRYSTKVQVNKLEKEQNVLFL